VLVDKIVSMEFELQQMTNFIMGYASYTTDAVAMGARIVNGKFRINFTENMYLFTVTGLMGYEPYTTETAEQSIATKKLWVDSDLTSEQLTMMIKNGKQAKMQEIIDGCEARVWGKGDTQKTENKWRKPFFTANVTNSWSGIDRKGFDIVVSYGDKEFPIGMRTEQLPSTVKVINGVFLTAAKQVIEPTSDSIFEEYSFMAKDLDNTIHTSK
jgi:hypothetical protein